MALANPLEAMSRLLERVSPVESEAIPLNAATGRILAQIAHSDRPSPPADVSAMDGYAVRIADITGASPQLAVTKEVAIGHDPPALPPGQAVRIFTGGAVPDGADAVIPREEVAELADAITLPADLTITSGQHIRRRGENLEAGQPVLEAGTPITAATISALAAFGITNPRVRRRLRLSLITTGNELLPVESTPQPWQLRDSNGPMLEALFTNIPWLEITGIHRVPDDPHILQSTLRAALQESDAILLTGGVSMGDYDYVPSSIEAVQGEIIFHKVAIRPGKPLLGAVGPAGQIIFGLPGNPVSALITARRFTVEALQCKAGLTARQMAATAVNVPKYDDQRLALWWYRPVRLMSSGCAQLVSTRGSGDLVSTARSDGFIEIAPDSPADVGFPFYPWSMT